MIDFEWDPAKAEANLRKHGVTFEFATAVFLDPDRIEELDQNYVDEERWIVTGRVEQFVLVVIFTLRDESIRIISARKGIRNEYIRYWSGQV
ncbi:BrnT family toxin [Acidicapsa acidisoli]|uniref:BrnT family toxin n=1 Tax=Acidicapsa acidisoli TaxID=1615681 RepID=UPI0021E01F05|nr:BrnT family toxin [Acidicapsa acidisoli]